MTPPNNPDLTLTSWRDPNNPDLNPKQRGKCVIPYRENTLLSHRRPCTHTILAFAYTPASMHMHTLTRVHPQHPQHTKTITRPYSKTTTRPDPMIMAETVLVKLRQERARLLMATLVTIVDTNPNKHDLKVHPISLQICWVACSTTWTSSWTHVIFSLRYVLPA